MRRCACILLVEFQNQFRCAWNNTCTEVVSTVERLDKSPEDIERDVKDMISRGGHYLNLELSLGPGSSLLLGTNVAESM